MSRTSDADPATGSSSPQSLTHDAIDARPNTPAAPCCSIGPFVLIGAAIRAARRGADPCELGLHLLALRRYDARRPDAAVRLTADWLARHLTGLLPLVSGQRGGDL